MTILYRDNGEGNIGHLLSEQTQISLLPMDIDYEAEKLRKQEESEQGYDLLGRESQSE